MNFSAIPAELRARPQWVVWRPELRQGKTTKPPYRSDAPHVPAVPGDPTTWGTFEQAVSCYLANSSVLGGIGYMLSADDPYVVFDVDDQAKAQPAAMTTRLRLIDNLLGLGTYAEASPSGAGLHVWVRARVGFKGRHMGSASGPLGIEVYAQQFITCTGRALQGCAGLPVADAQEFTDNLGLGLQAPRAVLTDDPSRPQGISDNELLDRARGYVSWFSDRWEARSGCEPGLWSHTFVAVVGVLEKHTGSVTQLQRVVESSPMVLAAAPAGTGETRLGKCRRTFSDVLARVRAGNRGSGGFVEHGERQYKNICAYKAKQAQERADALRAAVEKAGKIGGQAASLLDLFPDLGDEHRVLRRPPGLVGQFVEACERASHAPYIKFAIPATLSALAGIVGRRYKTGTGSGTNVNFILAAPSSTGKTQSMHAWQGFVNDAAAGMALTGAGAPRQRILNNGTASIQGIMHDFEESPSCAWFIEECQSQLTGMSHPKTPVEASLRDSYNQLYDCGKHSQTFAPPRSVASRNANIQPVRNLAVSTYWTTTTSKFDVFTDDALDGFLSRVIIIRHTGPAGSLQRYVRPLEPQLLDRLRLLMSYADALDKDYKDAATGGAAAMAAPSGPESRLVCVNDGYVHDLDWRLVEQCEVVKNASLSGDLPPTYTAISRLPQTAMRLACVMAAVENPNAPSVTDAQLKWAFGYLLQNLVALLSSMDSGEIGHVAGDEEAAVVRALRDLMARQEYRDMPGVPRNVLLQHLKGAKVFCRQGQSRSKAITAALQLMQQEGVTDELCPPSAKRGPPTKYVVPVLEHPIWRMVG